VTLPDDGHYQQVANRIKEGAVIPFLGAGANRCDRPDTEPWAKGRYLPDGTELASLLAEKSSYPDTTDTDLLRVSQYLDATLGERALYDYLHDVFEGEYPCNSLHRFLARIPPLLREKGIRQQLIITTNYDCALERAFDEQGQPYDVVWYEAKRGKLWGRFLHRPPEGKPIPIEKGNKYLGLSREDRTVILKLHGAVHPDADWDSYVITEDSYIDYLSRGDIASLIPITLREHMVRSNFLFLGYSMRDWNLRVILNRIWGSQQLDVKSWAVQREPPTAAAAKIEEALWRDRGDVTPIYAPLRLYTARLRKHVLGRAPVQAAA
jgi:SIR2-like domain